MTASHARTLPALCLVVALVARPALAVPPPAATTQAAAVDPVAAWNAILQLQRQRVADRLIALGRTPDLAADMARQLTPADLVVLAENPNMMQVAGATSARDLTLLWGVLIVAGLIALAAATDGFVSFG